ncbi:MAG: hypothetical protein ABI193_07710 [Minicystis sp.]
MSERCMGRLLWWSWGSIRKAFGAGAASIAVHGALLLPAFVFIASHRSAIAPDPVEPGDRWVGVTASLGRDRVYDVNVDAVGGQQAPASPDGPGAPGTPEPAPIATATATTTATATATTTAIAAKPKSKAKTKKAKGKGKDGDAGAPAAPGGGGEGGKVGAFGSEGAASVRDLGRAFTRAIPPAGQADLGWSALPVGDAGSIDVTLEIDETGHITGMKAPEGDPPRQLLTLVKRTLILLEAGTFAIRSGAVSAGTEVLRVHVTLRDGEPGSDGDRATGLSFAYERGQGTATFTQASGRRVEVSVKVIKAEAAPMKEKEPVKGPDDEASAGARPPRGGSRR